jgi:beta-galactosidase/beta-glucuronidase
MTASQICLLIIAGGNLKAQSLSAVENTVDMVSCSKQNFLYNQDFKIQNEAIVSNELVSYSNKIVITDKTNVEKINKAKISDQNLADMNFKNSLIHYNNIEYPFTNIFRDKIYCRSLEVKPPEIII